MNLSVAAFGKLSEEQKRLVDRAIQIENEERALYDERQSISRSLKLQGIDLWEEIRFVKTAKR